MDSQTLKIHHIVDIPRLDSQIATARDNRNRIHIFLIVNHNGPVYKRNGLAERWDELAHQDQLAVRALNGFNTAPRFSLSASAELN
jgi:hypothetical protein